ncbi:hypothetical protein ACFQPF_02810 [Fictibacillus iocasae]|uniref:Uncharacterized protein n=1 Tax=Fictibacillus iocasae TaxID=2715437 RepID=A0ABW2NN14_9BACL
MDAVSWIVLVAALLSILSSIWYYTSLGRRISVEEKNAGRDLSCEMNPYTGSGSKNEMDKKQD